MYTPDRVFLNDLKKLDPKLGCYFETNHDHFVITYERAVGGDVPVLLVEGEGGSFRHPNQRDITKLEESDTHKQSMKSRLNATATYMERVREKKKKEAKDNIRDMTKDDKRQIGPRMARLTNQGKFNSTFRRINLKKKGKSVDELQNAADN